MGLLLLAGGAPAELTEWPKNEGGNGHFYEAVLVPEGIDWNEAKAAAESAGGYLATTTSEEENEFVFGLVSGDAAFWIIDAPGNGRGPWLGWTLTVIRRFGRFQTRKPASLLDSVFRRSKKCSANNREFFFLVYPCLKMISMVYYGSAS